LTLPGFTHDFGSAVHPLGAGSPFFNSLPLGQYGLEWVHGEAPFAHPLDDGTAAVMERELADVEWALGPDGATWRRLLQPFVENWSRFAEDALGPVIHVPCDPTRMARFGILAVQSAQTFARYFRGTRARALFAGLAAHSFLAFDRPLSSAPALMLAIAAHAAGWPVPRGGAGAISRALIAHLESMGGRLHTGRRIDAQAFREIGGEMALAMFDTSPRGLVAIAGDRLPRSYKRKVEQFVPGPGAFKIDYALSEPVPWRAAECRRAITVHLGGSFEEIAAGESEVAKGGHPERPFVLAAQPTLFDRTRAPEGKHVFWVYCHVPNGSTVDMTERIERQIERFAPGFRDCVVARHVSPPAELEAADANLVGGDISGGAMTVRQFFFRPTLRGYSTGSDNLYLCSASTPPGGGVHGMCGVRAACCALRDLNLYSSI
jgi:phytoene dehydrogenase-like protein